MKGKLEFDGTIHEGVELRTMGDTDTAAFMRDADSETPEDVLNLINARIHIMSRELVEVHGYRALGEKQFPTDGPTANEEYRYTEAIFTLG